MAAVVNFLEKQRTILLHDYLVFVCGVDISRYIEDMNITYNDRNSPNSADFTVSNALEQFVLTNRNLSSNKWRLTDDRYTELPKFQIYQAKRHLSKRVAGGKIPLIDPVTGTFSEEQKKKIESGLIEEFQNQDFLERYAFGAGSCIFSRFDTVRIFIKHPYDPETKDRWVPFFTGTIQTKPLTTDYINGSSRISISAMDIRSEMMGMRVSVNPVQNEIHSPGNANESSQKANTVIFKDSADAGFFRDLYPTLTSSSSSGQSEAKGDNIFDSKSFVDMASMLITGLTGWVGNDVSYAKEDLNKGVRKEGFGVGFFKPGQVIRYGNEKNKALVKKDNFRSNLEEWDSLCLFGKSKNYFSRADCYAIGRASFWYKFDNNEAKVAKKDGVLNRFTPFDGYMHFLMPAEGLNVASMIVQSFDGYRDIAKNPDWTNRFELITRVCQQVDYEWSVTGNGDIVFEFPMYDFKPENFGGYSSLYIVDSHVHNDMVSDETGEIPAAIEATTTLTQFGDRQLQDAMNRLAQENGAFVQGDIAKAVVVSPILASKYGAKIVSHTFTGVPVQGLAKAATIEFQKRLADANKMTFDFTYRPYIRPNRPLLHRTRGRMGKITSISYSIPTYPSVPSNSVTVHCVKTPLFRNGENVFQHITGAENMPLSYNAIFESSTIKTDSGMNILDQSGSSTSTSTSNSSASGNNQDVPVRDSLNQTNENSNETRFDTLFRKYAKRGVTFEQLKSLCAEKTNMGMTTPARIGLESPHKVQESKLPDGMSWGIMGLSVAEMKIKYDPNVTPTKLNDPEYSIKWAAEKLYSEMQNDQSR